MADHTLVDRLGFEIPRKNGFRRLVSSVVSTRMATPLLARFLGGMDNALLRLSSGRWSVAGLLAGQPVITLVTTGARTQQPRTSVLNAFPLDGDLTVVGTNFGRSNHPGWVYNLRANPVATVTYGGITVQARAEPLDETARSRVFAHAIEVHTGYAHYRAHVTNRPIEMFRLRAV